jgi:hypothetical protein
MRPARIAGLIQIKPAVQRRWRRDSTPDSQRRRVDVSTKPASSVQNAPFPFPATQLPKILSAPLRSAILCSLLLVTRGHAMAADPCPDVSGQYSVTGFGKALGDVLQALQAEQAGFRDSGVELHGAADGELTVGVKSGSTGVWSTRPVVVLQKGKDFDCKGGALLFHPVADTSRKTDEGTWYEGASTISLSAGGHGELVIDVSFTGSERISLFSYESANVSVPRLGTRTTLREAIRWPAYSDPVPPVAKSSGESNGVADVRAQLTSAVLGNVILGWVGAGAAGVEVTLNAPHSDDIARFEERLRVASINYRITTAPIWTNNAYYMALEIQPR